jgi:uncharacterized protein
MSKNSWIQTYTGRKFFPLEPKAEDINIEDIAHGLSNQCRFNGHSKQFYSVAQHSVDMIDRFFRNDNDLARYALLHDASEAYLSDIPRPLKLLPEFDFYRTAEKKLEDVIYKVFGLSPLVPKEIKWADKELLKIEASSNIMAPLHPDWEDRVAGSKQDYIMELPPLQAKEVFLVYFNKLFIEPKLTIEERMEFIRRHGE